MSDAKEFISLEKDKFGKIFVDVTYAIDNISPFIEGQDLKKRKYYIKLPVLKKYLGIIDASMIELNKKSLFSFFSSSNCLELVKDFKRDNIEQLTQLEKCSTCACLNCTAQCAFDSCLGCRHGSKITYCDHEKINMTTYDIFSLELTNDRTGATDRYFVLATLQDSQLDRKYIIIKNSAADEKFVLYFYPGISEDQYGEITDAEEFDFVVSTFESNCI
jgi:hypothetical protein